MPRKPINWANTIIYVIRSLADPTLIYVGSTTDYIKRKNKHKSCCKSAQTKLYEMIRANGGWDSFSMVEHSKFPCENKRHAEKEEERVRLELQANLNTIRAYRTPEQKVEQTKENGKKYYELHKVEIAEQQKKHYEENKLDILKYHKEYKELHKEENKEYQKKYYEENKEYKKECYELKKEEILEKHKEKITCECGCIVTKYGYNRHCLSQKHINLIKNK
jgi:hypothetical protein